LSHTIVKENRTISFLYTLSLHDALPIYFQSGDLQVFIAQIATGGVGITLTAADTAIFYSTDFSLANYEQAKARLHRIGQKNSVVDRKSTRLNSSHVKISYAVFCMKKHNI